MQRILSIMTGLVFGLVLVMSFLLLQFLSLKLSSASAGGRRLKEQMMEFVLLAKKVVFITIQVATCSLGVMVLIG